MWEQLPWPQCRDRHAQDTVLSRRKCPHQAEPETQRVHGAPADLVRSSLPGNVSKGGGERGSVSAWGRGREGEHTVSTGAASCCALLSHR